MLRRKYGGKGIVGFIVEGIVEGIAEKIVEGVVERKMIS